MPINLVGFTPTQVQAASKTKKSSGIKTTTVRKKVSQETTIYGEELLNNSIRKEREIQMHFSDFNKYSLRFSDDGEFILGYKFIDYDNQIFTLYHCLDPVLFDLELEELEESDRIHKYLFNNLRDAADKLFAIVRKQLLEEKNQKVIEQTETDNLNFKLEQERKEAFEAELEAEFANNSTEITVVESEIVSEVKKPIFFKKIVTTEEIITTEVSNDEVPLEEVKKSRQFFVFKRNEE